MDSPGAARALRRAGTALAFEAPSTAELASLTAPTLQQGKSYRKSIPLALSRVSA